MKLNMKNLNPGTFFEWEGEPDGSTNGITVRALSGGEIKRINKATFKRKDTQYSKKGVPFQIEIYDEDKRDEMIYDYCIVNWTGLEDDAGKPIPCNTANKVKLMNEEPIFMTYVTACIEQVSNIAAEVQESAEKN